MTSYTVFRCGYMSLQHFYEFVVIGVTWSTQYIDDENAIIIYWRAHTNASRVPPCASPFNGLK